MEIGLKIVDQAVTFFNTPLIFSGAVNTLKVKCEFNSTWDGFGKTAVFYREIDNPLFSVVGPDNTCAIPADIVADEGAIYIGVFGTKDSDIITTEVIKYVVGKGAQTSGEEYPEPSADVWQQILSNYGEAMQKINDVNETLIQKIETETSDRKTAVSGLSSELKQEIDVERKRINSFTALEEGSTTGDAELKDIRVGYDGTEYETAGEAVREQVGSLSEEIDTKFDTYDKLLGVDVHNFTYIKPKLIRCNWNWAENEVGSLCKTEALETPQYIIVNKNVKCNANGANMFSASSDFGSASPSPFGILFRKQYTANEMVPTYMYGDENYKYFRMMFPYSADLEVTFVYDTFRPCNDYEDDTTTVLGNTDIQTHLGIAYEESGERLRLFAFVPYYPKTYYFKRASFASTLIGNDKSVFGVYDDIMLGDTIPQNVILSTSADGYRTPYTYARKIGEVTDITKDGDSLRSYIFDGSNIQSYYPKYIAFPIAQIAGSYTDRKTALDVFNGETEIDHWKGWDASLISLSVSKGGLNFIDLKSSPYVTPFSASPLIASSWILFGDSLTHQYCGQNYNDDLPAAKIAREFNISFDNRAYSGTHICTGGSVDDSTHNGVAMLDALISEIEEGTTTAPDYITIAYGSNGSSTNTGTTESTSENTDTTIGAMKYFIEKIREKMPETVFGFILPPKSTWNGNYGRDVAATRNAMLECLALEDYHVPYCDMWTESGITLAMLPDSIHIKTAQSQNLYYHALRRFMMGL